MSTAPAKIYGHAKLLALPERKQKAIEEMCSEMTLKKGQKELAKAGIKVAMSTLGYFLTKRRVNRQFRETKQLVADFVSLLEKRRLNIPKEAMFDYAQEVFTLEALKAQSVSAWAAVQRVNSSHEGMKLRREQFEFDAAKRCLAHAGKLKALAKSTEGSEREKIDKARALIFGSTPA